MLELKDYIYCFSKDNKPLAYCEDGDVVKFYTKDCFNEQVTHDSEEELVLDEEHTNPATGPLYINGAKENDVLKVEILDIKVAQTGVVSMCDNDYPLGHNSNTRTRIINIKDGYAYFNDLCWPIDTMIGVIGTARKDRDVITYNVFENGGNMDSNIITKGNTLYLPVSVDGGLLAMGDLHATMGDGEVAGTGIEISGEVTVKVSVIKNFKLNWPITETKDAYYVNTCGPTCDEAIQKGYEEMQRLIGQAYNFDLTDATLYMSMRGMINANQACLSKEGGGNSFRIGTPKINGKPLIKG